MNVREEDRQRNSCSGRGLGLAAAAIGVGVGAALYYYFSKSPETPAGQGSSNGWSEQPHALHYNMSSDDDQDNSYLTISEHSTSDTSVHESSEPESSASEDGSESLYSTPTLESISSDESELDVGSDFLDYFLPIENIDSDSDTFDWEVTSSSVGVPEDITTPSPLRMLFEGLSRLRSPSPRPQTRMRRTEDEQLAILREQALYYNMSSDDDQDNSLLAISEHSTSDTSVHESSEPESSASEDGSESSYSTPTLESISSDESELDVGSDFLDYFLPIENIDSDSDTFDWEVTSSSVGVPEDITTPSPLRMLFEGLSRLRRPSPRPQTRMRRTEDEQLAILREQALYYNMSSDDDQDNSLLAISEHSTSDTSVHESSEPESSASEDGSESSYSTPTLESISSDESELDVGSDFLDYFLPIENIDSDSDTFDWEVTSSSVGVPEDITTPSPLRMLFEGLSRLRRPSPRPQTRMRRKDEDQLRVIREQSFRERSWSLEECSICFDVILKDQQVTTLPCTHHFHASCIAPWLQEQQTCPNCRKAAE